jgi:hypothetical protein
VLQSASISGRRKTALALDAAFPHYWIMGRPSLLALVLGGAAWLVIAGCGGASRSAGRPAAAVPDEVPAELAPGPLGLVPGEQMAFEVKVGGILAGEAVLAVGEPGDVGGTRAIAVRSRIASAGAAALIKHVVDEATTVVDLATARPMTMSTDVTYGEIAYHVDAEFNGSKVTVALQRRGHTRVLRSTSDFGTAIAHDAHTAMAAIRTWRAEPGATRTLWVMGGRRLWRSDVTFTGPEAIGTAAGNTATLRLDGIAYRLRPDRKVDPDKDPRHFTVWMSDDADRVPVRVTAETEFGIVTIDLVDYQRP